jgi:hypothetical protein
MTITITKGRLIRWIIAAAILFSSAGHAVDVPRAVTAAIEAREFMAGFSGYDDYSLLDVYELRPGFIGVAMLCPIGFHETLVFDYRNGNREVVYRDAYIPSKKRREAMRREGISAADAVKLARAALKVNDGDMLLAGN